jgi:voltage-gated potassium channel
MTTIEAPKKEIKNLGYEIFVGVLSILSILNIFLAILYKDADMQGILDIMNGLFSIIFLGDFTYRILTTDAKSDYFFRKFGWADLLASLPFPQAKILRVFRLFRVYRLMRDVGPKKIADTLIKDRAGSALYVLLLMGILVLEFGALAVLKQEKVNPDANIKTASDAVWYVIVTISTVGYGDRYPTTGTGRIIGALIILVGVGIFGTFTGFLANFFLSPAKKEEEDAAPEK